jgi:hypothetical protein
LKKNPGPGQYADTSNHLKSAPAIGFGAEERKYKDVKMVPGPGSYVHKEILGNHGPKYQIGGKNNYSPI